MRVRYVGPDQGRDLAVPGGVIQFEKGEWVDVVAACEAALIPPRHLEVIVPGLGDHWEIDLKQTKTKAAKADDDEEPDR